MSNAIASAEKFSTQRIAELVRSSPAGFKTAGEWLDGEAARQKEELLNTFTIASYRPPRPQKQRTSSKNLSPSNSQTEYAAAKFAERQQLDQLSRPTAATLKRLKEEYQSQSALIENYGHFETTQGAARRLLLHNEPWSKMDPEERTERAQRVLLVAWILTDADDLSTGKMQITNLQSWQWGKKACEMAHLLAPGLREAGGDRDGRFRRWAYRSIFEPDKSKWLRLVRRAICYLPAPAQRPAANNQLITAEEYAKITGLDLKHVRRMVRTGTRLTVAAALEKKQSRDSLRSDYAKMDGRASETALKPTRNSREVWRCEKCPWEGTIGADQWKCPECHSDQITPSQTIRCALGARTAIPKRK